MAITGLSSIFVLILEELKGIKSSISSLWWITLGWTTVLQKVSMIREVDGE